MTESYANSTAELSSKLRDRLFPYLPESLRESSFSTDLKAIYEACEEYIGKVKEFVDSPSDPRKAEEFLLDLRALLQLRLARLLRENNRDLARAAPVLRDVPE